MSATLTDGTVTIGPDNKTFEPRPNSRVLVKKTSYEWIKSRPTTNFYNTMPRQLRSKYDEEVTMAPYAAVHPLLNHHTTMPVTLKTLYAFKCKNEWSGIKVAAFVFYQMYSERRIAKQRVMEMLSCCKAKSGNTFKIVQRMVELMKEEETFPVSKPVCKCLTDLAGALSGEITSLNNTIVKPAVLKKLRSMAS